MSTELTFNNWVNEGLVRRIDDHGRVILPSSLRTKLNIRPGDEFEFFTTLTVEGKNAICLIQTQESKSNEFRYKIAAEVLRELGYKIPAELANS